MTEGHPGKVVDAISDSMSSYLPNFDTNEFKTILPKVFGIIEPSGIFMVLGGILYNSRLGQFESANSSIEETLMEGHNEIFTELDVYKYLKDIGFVNIEY